jgi:hypothetical protein
VAASSACCFEPPDGRNVNDFNLPPLTPDAVPKFVDAATAKAWVASVPLANVAGAQQQLLEQLQQFNRCVTRPSARVAALEVLREPVHFVQIEQAKRFTNRALPMAAAEAAVFEQTIALWEQMRIGYLRCLAAVLADEAGMRVEAARVCQRALVCAGLKMFHHYRACRVVPRGEWRGLHAVYAKAEALEVTDQVVAEPMNRDVLEATPRIAYLRAVLMGMASPNELSQRQLTYVAHLLERWASKVAVTAGRPAPGALPPLVADLESDACPARGGPAARTPRILETDALEATLRNRIGLLRRGESPVKLALGEDCVQPMCEQLLVFLHRQWCRPPHARGAERRPASGVALAGNDLAAIHYHISGKMFRQPGAPTELSKREREELATFGRISTRDDYGHARGYELEPWQLRDESATGLKIARAPGGDTKRHSSGQLIVLRREGTQQFRLGQMRWILQLQNGEIVSGIRLLPGLPAAIAVRSTGLNVANEKYMQALSLTQTESAPPTLVLPLGWYKPKRVVEVYVEAPARTRLLELLERGSDYDRVAYEVVG